MLCKDNTKNSVKKIAGQAWQHMTMASISPSPENFLVWYAYYSGFNIDLNKEIDRLLSTEENFTPEVNTSLYKLSHQGETDPALLSEIHAATGEIITEIIDGVRTTSINNQDYQKNLKNLDGDLKSIKNVQGLRDMMNGLVNGNQQIESSSNTLNDLLNKATFDIKQLETRLEEAERAANTDSLTGIYNRHAFEKKISDICHNMQPETPSSLIMIDIDHFKRFNDTYGHRVGDAVLRGVAQTFAPNIPENGFPARYGGEEFAVILPGIDLTEAMAVADKLRNTIARRELRRERDGAKMGKVTISLGVASVRSDDNAGSLVERADKALYKAKNNGRNQVESEVSRGRIKQKG